MTRLAAAHEQTPPENITTCFTIFTDFRLSRIVTCRYGILTFLIDRFFELKTEGFRSLPEVEWALSRVLCEFGQVPAPGNSILRRAFFSRVFIQLLCPGAVAIVCAPYANLWSFAPDPLCTPRG